MGWLVVVGSLHQLQRASAVALRFLLRCPAFSQKEQNGPFFAFSWSFQTFLPALTPLRHVLRRAEAMATSQPPQCHRRPPGTGEQLDGEPHELRARRLSASPPSRLAAAPHGAKGNFLVQKFHLHKTPEVRQHVCLPALFFPLHSPADPRLPIISTVSRAPSAPSAPLAAPRVCASCIALADQMLPSQSLDGRPSLSARHHSA